MQSSLEHLFCGWKDSLPVSLVDDLFWVNRAVGASPSILGSDNCISSIEERWVGRVSENNIMFCFRVCVEYVECSVLKWYSGFCPHLPFCPCWEEYFTSTILMESRTPYSRSRLVV